jgi:hypothetical protein
MYYQQGDVLIKKVSKVYGEKLNHTIIAKGETTGHAHRVTGGNVELYEKDGTLYMSVKSDTAVVSHEEHGAIEIEFGNYKIGGVKEYDHFAEEARRVAD